MSILRTHMVRLVILTLTMPAAVILSTYLASRSFEQVHRADQTIRVKGYAEKPIVSDWAEWSASVVVRHEDRTTAYALLEQHREQVVSFLESQGFARSTVELGPVHIKELATRDSRGHRTHQIEQYEISQVFSVSSAHVDQIATAARLSAGLISQGVALRSSAPRYLYTGLDTVKLEMLEQATENARERALLLVGGAGNQLGPLHSAKQGVFQITPQFSSEVSGSGYNDTSSLHKVIKAVATFEFTINP